MQDKIAYIESLYQSQIRSANLWREQALMAVHQEMSLSSQPLSSPPQIINSLKWKGEPKQLEKVYQTFDILKIIDKKEVKFEGNFSPHFYDDQLILSLIKLKNIKKAVWAFFILQFVARVITNEHLHIALPLHCSKKDGEPLSPDTVETYLCEIRKEYKNGNVPEFVTDILLHFPHKS